MLKEQPVTFLHAHILGIEKNEYRIVALKSSKLVRVVKMQYDVFIRRSVNPQQCIKVDLFTKEYEFSGASL